MSILPTMAIVPPPLSKKQTLYLLRWVLIIASAYLFLFSIQTPTVLPALALLIAAAFLSNLLLSHFPERWVERPGFDVALVLLDTLWVSLGAFLTHNLSGDFFLLYFLIILSAVAGERLKVIAFGAVIISVMYIGVLAFESPSSLLASSAYLLRIPFFFAVALFYGYLVDRTRRERKQRQAELQRLPARLRQAQESERRRIARELHDGVAQTLSALFMHLDLLDNMVESLPLVRERLGQIKSLVEQALKDIRRLVCALWPTVLDDLGLPDALRGLVASLPQSTPIEIVLHIDENFPPLSSTVETALYRIVQEALSNVFQHARASQVRVHLGTANGALQLTVADNGQGINPSTGGFETLPYPAQDRQGIGLWSMRERAEEVGGRFSLRSSPGQGTTILVSIPVVLEKNNMSYPDSRQILTPLSRKTL